MKTAKVGGEGGIDYIFADTAGRRLYITRGATQAQAATDARPAVPAFEKRLTIFDLDTLEPVGVIPGVGGNGATVCAKTGHGFTSDHPQPSMFDAAGVRHPECEGRQRSDWGGSKMSEGVRHTMARKMKRQTRAGSKSSTKVKAKKTRAKSAPKPAAVRAKGPQSLAAGLTANDAAASIKWYCDVLGFSLEQRWEQEGTFLGGSVVRGGVTFNIGQDDWKLGRDRKKGQGVRLFITTADDIDKYAKAITSHGGTLDHEPKDEWGFRAFALTDPDGYKITVMRPLK